MLKNKTFKFLDFAISNQVNSMYTQNVPSGGRHDFKSWLT